MNEKKLTDEEVVKALENKAMGYGAGIVGDLYQPTLDLIHRLQAENERLTERVFDCTAVIEYNEKCSKEIQAATILLEQRNNEIAELQKQVNELKKERENVQKILYELGKCGNDKERYAVWVKLIKYCGVEVE
jgi:predicted RNase H-like nuclease (RuvC/YqgF family)